MTIDIIAEPLEVDVYGFSGIAVNGNYASTAFKLSYKM